VSYQTLQGNTFSILHRFVCLFSFLFFTNRDVFIHLSINLHHFPWQVNLEHNNMYSTFFPLFFLSDINFFLHCDIYFPGFITFISTFSKLSLILNNRHFYPVPGHVLLFRSVIHSNCPTKACRTLVKTHAITARKPQLQSGLCQEHPHCSCCMPFRSPVFSLALGHICTVWPHIMPGT